MYRRASGSDLTATSASAVPAATMVIAVTYPSVRITFLLLLADPRQRPATLMSLIPEQAAHRTGGRSGRRRTHCPPAAGLLTWLPSSATAADEDASLRFTACQRAAMSRR